MRGGNWGRCTLRRQRLGEMPPAHEASSDILPMCSCPRVTPRRTRTGPRLRPGLAPLAPGWRFRCLRRSILDPPLRPTDVLKVEPVDPLATKANHGREAGCRPRNPTWSSRRCVDAVMASVTGRRVRLSLPWAFLRARDRSADVEVEYEDGFHVETETSLPRRQRGAQALMRRCPRTSLREQRASRP